MFPKASTSFKRIFGPSTLVAAAFIGPGTLTVCTLAGVQTGYGLLWALLFSVLATMLLQEMSARLGLISQSGLGEAVRKHIRSGYLRIFALGLMFMAIVFGNAAYEAGNISGAVLGLSPFIANVSISVFGFSVSWPPLLIGSIAGGILYTGSFRSIERFLITLVLMMSFVFMATAILVKPNITEILKGLFLPGIGSADWLLVIALIGTTVVPYNLFLHASSVSQKWKNAKDLRALRIENIVAIGLGGIISMSIVITSAVAFQQGNTGISSVADMAVQLQPLLGATAPVFLGIGLFAAGISSAITAPLAAAFAARGIFGWEIDLKHPKFRLVWGSILFVGVFFSSLGYNPVLIIRFAQAANGLLLPFIAIFLVIVMNRTSLLGRFVNSRLQNIGSIGVILVTLLISARLFYLLFMS